MPTNDQVREAVERYATAVGSADREAIVACFAEDAEVVDPYPSDAWIGHEAIGKFWDNVFSMGVPRSFTVEHVSVTAETAAFVFFIVVAVGEGSFLGVRGIDVVKVDDEGRIAALTAYWEPGSLAPVELGEDAAPSS